MANFALSPRALRIRIVVSVALYCVFLLLGVSAAMTGTNHAHATILTVFLLSAYFLLPRRSALLSHKPDGAETTPEFRQRMVHLTGWMTRVRLVYFLGAVALLLVLPSYLQVKP